MQIYHNIENPISDGHPRAGPSQSPARNFHIPIHSRHRKFLPFQVLGKVFQFRALPFGLKTAPRLFTKVASQLKKMGSRLGIRVHQYIDEWLNRALSEAQASLTTQLLLNLIEELGWIVNLAKSELVPTQVFKFLSYQFNLARGLVFPMEKRFQKLILVLSPLLASPIHNTSQCYKGIRSHGINFQASPPKATIYETNTAGSCPVVGLESSTGLSNQNLTSCAGTYPVVDHPGKCDVGCTITSTKNISNCGGLHGCVPWRVRVHTAPTTLLRADGLLKNSPST